MGRPGPELVLLLVELVYDTDVCAGQLHCACDDRGENLVEVERRVDGLTDFSE
jgi:hypothetical protein